jgi:hypothetical protein
MSVANVESELELADMGTNLSFFRTPEGLTFGAGKTVGNGIQGWAPNALFVHTDGTANTRLYYNSGTKDSATWTPTTQPDGTIIPASIAATGSISAGTFFSLADNLYFNFGGGNDLQMKWYTGAAGPDHLSAGPATGMWANAPSEADPRWPQVAHCFYDDFKTLDTTTTTGLWTPFVVGTGTTAPADDVGGGGLVMTCQATTDDACEQIILKSAPFLLAAGKTLWYETNLKLTGDVQSEVSFGLASVGEDLKAVADVYPEDGISIANQNGSLANALTCSKSGTDTGAVAGINTMVSGTYVTYGLLVDGVTSVTPYINGTAGTAATATICDDQSLAPYFLVRNGDATTQQILNVRYVKVVQLR